MKVWPQGVERHIFDVVGSTLEEAARLAPELRGPAWILAAEQTAGRGRRGRAWQSPRGNFSGTLVMPMADAPDQAALRSFVMSLALYRSFVDVTDQPDAFSLKWPNDVLLQGGKVAGILLETNGPYLIIGVGVNLVASPPPESLEARAVAPRCLRDLDAQVTPEAFLTRLAQHFDALETQFTTYGFAPIRTAWLAHAARLGEVITARTMRDETIGTFEDVDEAGNLILRNAKGRVSITAADVYF